MRPVRLDHDRLGKNRKRHQSQANDQQLSHTCVLLDFWGEGFTPAV
jgi:hypothetical protein